MRKEKKTLVPAARRVSAIDRIVGRNLRLLRQASGRAQQEAGMAAGVTLQQLQKYENGINRLSLGALLALRRFYDVPLKILLQGLPEDLTGFSGEDVTPAHDAAMAVYARLSRIRDPALLGRIGRIIDVMLEPG